MTNIIRKQNGAFTVIRNALVNDERLSLEAIGLLTWLLSKPNNWKVIQSHIAATFGLGRDKVRKLVNELIECRYLHKSTVRNEDGEFSGVTYVLYDVPPETDFPSTDNPASDLPTSENQSLINTNSKQSLKGSKNPNNRGARVSEQFVPDDKSCLIAQELGVEIDRQVIEAFIDYWKAVPGQKGIKLDWQATFRNQLRHIAKTKGRPNANNSKPEFIHPATVAANKLRAKLGIESDSGQARHDGDDWIEGDYSSQ